MVKIILMAYFCIMLTSCVSAVDLKIISNANRNYNTFYQPISYTIYIPTILITKKTIYLPYIISSDTPHYLYLPTIKKENDIWATMDR